MAPASLAVLDARASAGSLPVGGALAGTEGSEAERRLLAEPVVEALRALDGLWVELAGRCGFRIVRSLDAWVAYDGQDGIHVAAPEELDEDDCLAQILLHELCHWLVEGEASRVAPDWGLCNEDGRDLGREHAALALQRVCTRAHGLEEIFAPTTEHWRLWRRLPGWNAEAEEQMLRRWRAHAAGEEPGGLAVPRSEHVSAAGSCLASQIAAAIERAARLGVLAAMDQTLRITAQRLGKEREQECWIL